MLPGHMSPRCILKRENPPAGLVRRAIRQTSAFGTWLIMPCILRYALISNLQPGHSFRPSPINTPASFFTEIHSLDR